MLKHYFKLFSLELSLLLIGYLIDIILLITSAPRILVSEDYIYYIFAAVVTVGSLGSTIFSLILSISDITCLGFTLKEILRFDHSLIKVNEIIFKSMAPILFGIIALTFNLTNSMTILLVYEIFNIILFGSKTIKMILDNEKLQDIVLGNVNYKIQKNELTELFSYIIIWEKELVKAIEVGDKTLQKRYWDLFDSVYTQPKVQSAQDAKLRIEQTVRNIFPNLVRKSGFGNAYQEVFYRNNCSIYDSTVAVEHYMNEIQYANVESRGLLDVSPAIKSILNTIQANDEEIAWILYDYFSAIQSNRIISDELKNEKIKDFFDILCEINHYSTYCDARKRTIEYCFCKDILQNGRIQEGKTLFTIMMRSLYFKNEFWGVPLYYHIVASMFRGAFFSIEYERETLKEEHRLKVKEIICSEIDTINMMRISMSSILKVNVGKVLEYYIEDSFKKDFGELYEYFPEGYGAKATIWTREKRIEFAFLFYLVIEQQISSFPLESYFLNEEISSDKKRAICMAILNLYNDEDVTLNVSAQEQFLKLQDYLNESCEVSPYCLEENYEKINKILQELNAQTYKTDKLDIDILSLQQQLEEKIKDKQEFLWDNKINLENADEFQINPRFIRKSQLEKVDGYLLNCLDLAIKSVVSQCIQNQFKSIKLTFDAAGVAKLKDELTSNSYKICNYTFVDDWALNETVRSSIDYLQLKDEVSKIKFESYSHITEYIFLSSKISLNAEVLLVEGRELTIEQIHQYLKGVKIVEGKYKLDQAIYNTQEAVEWVKGNIRIQYTTFKIKIIADGFTIDLVRGTRL